MGNYADREYKRLEGLLSKDKSNINKSVNNVLKAEVYDILSNYMMVDNIECYTNLQKNGAWQIKIVANTNNFYSLKTTM